jgi:hypothetical protein
VAEAEAVDAGCKRVRPAFCQMTLKGEPAGYRVLEDLELHRQYMEAPRPSDDDLSDEIFEDSVNVDMPDGSIVPLWLYMQFTVPKQNQKLWRAREMLKEIHEALADEASAGKKQYCRITKVGAATAEAPGGCVILYVFCLF